MTKKKEESKEIKAKRKQILDNIPNLSQQNWSYYNDAYRYMNENVWTRIHPNIVKSDPMAFVTRSKGLTGVYEVFTHPNVPKACTKPLELHEFGHIIFTHMSLQNEARDILIRKIMSFWSSIKAHFEDEAIENEKKSATETAKQICSSMLNIAMDFEVNSRLFTKEEWPIMQYYSSYAMCMIEAKNPYATEESLDKVIEWLNKPEDERMAHTLFKGCWPEDSGFPIGLDYNQYIDLMLMNQDKFFSYMKVQLSNGKGQGKGQGNGKNGKGKGKGQGNGSGSGESDEENEGNGSSSSKGSSEGDEEGEGTGAGKLTTEDIDKMRSQYSDTDEEASEKAKEEAGKDDGNGDEDENGDEDSGSGSGRNKDSSNSQGGTRTGQLGWGPKGNSKDTTDYEINITDPHGLEDIIIKACFNKHVINQHNNTMYFYNRRKYNNDIIISKLTKEDVYRPGNIYLLVDCSCSVDIKAIKAMVRVINKVNRKCGKKSRLIWWDTELSGDYPLKKNVPTPKTFGNTWIADGIKYVRKNYLKSSNDKLIIISDFCDSLHHWNVELEKVKQDALGICWRSSKYTGYNREAYLGQIVDVNSDDGSRDYKHLIRKLNPIFVNI